MTQTLERRQIKDMYVANNTCWRYTHLYLLIMLTERYREHKRPIHTSHTCATYLYMCACWSIIRHAHLRQQITENYYIWIWQWPLQQDMTAIHALDREDLFGKWYILETIPKLHQSSLNVCKHITARCQQMHRIDTNSARNTLKVNDTNRWSTKYSTIKNVIQPRSKPASPISTNSTSGVQR